MLTDGFDRLLAMDREHLESLRRSCPTPHRDKLGMFLDFSQRFEADEVPDPYYGDESGFERVLDLCERAASGLLKELARDLPPPSP